MTRSPQAWFTKKMKATRPAIAIALGLVLSCLPGNAAAEALFTVVSAAKTGEIEVDVESVTDTTLHYIHGSKRKKMKLARLDPANREALVAFARERGIYDRYPPLKIQVAIRDNDKLKSNSSYMRHLWLIPRLVIEGEEALTPIPPVEATISVICADTKALYRDRRKHYQVRTKETLLIPAAPDSARREIDFKTFELEFDEDKNSSNVGGWIYKYWICCLRDPETKRIVRFETSYNLLEKYVEENPGERNRFVEIGIGGTVPTTLSEMDAN